MKELKHIPVVTSKQVEFCKKIGLRILGDTIGVAEAKLLDLLEIEFHGKQNFSRPTPKQIALAAQFGYDISSYTRRVGDAIISDIMTELNLESIEKQDLVPGSKVVNKRDSLKSVETISSIQSDGTVYFKGGNGKRAWARNLVKVDEA